MWYVYSTLLHSPTFIIYNGEPYKQALQKVKVNYEFIRIINIRDEKILKHQRHYLTIKNHESKI